MGTNKDFLSATKQLVAAAAVVFALSVCPSARGLTFSDSGQSLAFTNPAAGALADVNGDGRADIVISSTTKNEIWTGGASGTFTNSGQNLGAGNGSFAVRDFDGDGDLDLALGSSGAGIKIWVNNGSGTFSDSGQSLGGGGAAQIAALDVDGDNDIDLVEGRNTSPMNLWLNNGAGGFSLSATSVSQGSVAAMKVADFNADGYQDIVVADQTALTVYYGDGLGGFSGQAASTLTGAGQTLCVDDYNTDSKPHIASMSSAGANVLYQTMTAPQSYIDKSINFGGYESTGCVAGDLDNDGDVDIMQTGAAGGYARFWLNDGLMSFASHTQAISTGASFPVGISDVDADGDGDLVFVVTSSGTGKVYLSDMSATLSNAAPAAPWLNAVGTPTTRKPSLTWSAVTDDHTSSPSVSYNVRIATQTGKYSVYSGLSEEGPGHVRGTSFTPGSLPDATYYWAAQAVDTAGKKSAWSSDDTFSVSLSFTEKPGPVKTTGSTQTVQFTTADFDADGDIDIVSSSAESSFRRFYKNNGGGTFTESGGAVSSTYSRAADIDNDGDLDLVNSDSVYKNNGVGSFSSAGQSISVWKMCLADADRDGDIDIISGQTDKLYLNNGSGVFSRSGQSSFMTSVNVKCADMDLDGDVDAVVYSPADTSLRVWPNNGEGWFGTSAAQTVTAAEAWDDFTLSDYDSDGDMDVLPTRLKILVNSGGTLTESSASLFGGFPKSIAQGDLDNNGAPDVFITAAGTGLSGIVWMNTGGTFSTIGEVFTQTGYGDGVTFADFNGDKYNDIVTSAGSVFLNDMYNGPGGNAPANTPPTTPALTHHSDSATSTVTLTWTEATDAQTAAAAITYNVRVGTSPGSGNVYSGAAPIGPGKDGSLESLTLRRLPNATIYWSVQSVDAGFATSAWAADDSFTVNVTFAMADGGQSIGTADTAGIAAADFDGDGDIDFAEGNNGASAVWLNSGSGTYTQGGSLGTAFTKAAAAADFDDDGDVDIALGNTDANEIFLNNGSGSFSQQSQPFGADSTLSIAAADLDGDGDVDLFAGTAGADKVAINDGAASFTIGSQSLGSLATNDVALADFDKDGDIDAFTCETGIARVWLNDGEAAFTANGQTLGAETNQACAAGDVDRDGDMDVVVGTDAATKIYINNGSATMSDSGQTLNSGNTVDVVLADFDHDGDADIFTAASATSSKVWVNNGNGVFTDLGGSYGGGSLKAAAVADIDGDKDVDVILGYSGADKTLLNNVADSSGGNSPNDAPSAPLLNEFGVQSVYTTALSWLPAVDSVTPMSQMTYNVRMGTSPGGNDVISGAIGAGPGNTGQYLFRKITGLYPGTYYWSVQAVDGDNARSAWSAEDSFVNVAPFRDSGQSFAAAKTRAVSAGHFNSDTMVDAVTGVDGASKLWLNMGGGQLMDSGVSVGSAATISTFASDFDGDGDTDLVKAEYDGSAHTYFNGGSGAMASSQTILLSGLSVFGVSGGDVDLDGDTDLVFATFGGNNKIYLNDGKGSFSSSTNEIVSSSSYCMYPADVNRDGAVDFIDGTSDGIKVWKNYKDGSFYSGGTAGTGAALAVTAADFNADGWPDVARGYGAKVIVYTNDNGYILADSAVTLTATGSVMALAAADVDLDGDFDIIAAMNKGVKIFMNEGSMSFSDSVQQLGPNDTRAIGVADVDGDSDIDILSGNYNEAAVLWENLRISSGSSVSANTAPSAPSVIDTATSTSNVALKWSGGSDATTPSALLRYNVRVGKSPGAQDAKPPLGQEGIYDAAATSAIVVNLSPGTYYWSVRTVDSAQLKSSWSAEDQFTVVPPDTTPPVFSGVTAASDTTLGGTVDLSWSAATDESEPVTYLIYYALATATMNYSSSASTTTGLTARITGLTNNTGYKFAVRARDAKGNTNANLVVAYATPTYAGEVRPAAPANLAAVVSSGIVGLTWAATTLNTDGSAITDLAGYNVYRDVQCGGTSTVKLNTSAATATAWSDSAVLPDNIYYYTVKAVNTKAVESAASQCAAASTYTKGVQGYVKKFDTSGGTVYAKGYTLVPEQGITFKLYDNNNVLAGQATSDAAGYFFISMPGDTTGKKYMLIQEVTEASGYLATSGTFQAGVGKRAIATDITIGNSVITQKVPNVGVGPSVGDSNCDWVVNLFDFTSLKTVFSKKKGETGYTRNIDVNGDEAINLPDFMIQKQNFSLKGNPVAPSPCF